MSKFDYDVFANDETTAAIFNFEKWSKEDAIEQARFELELDVEAELEVEDLPEVKTLKQLTDIVKIAYNIYIDMSVIKKELKNENDKSI